jgi:hypothetical protein
MTGKDMTEIERSLERLVPKSAPPGLRRRIVASAFEARKSAAMTTGWRAALAVCAVVLVAVFATDTLITRHESASLTALLDGRSFVKTPEDDTSVVAEMLGATGDQDIAMRVRMLTSDRVGQDIERQRNDEALKRLKGWLRYESLEDLN